MNPSDILTKGVSREKLQALLPLVHMQAQGGRPDIAPIRDNTIPRYGPTVVDEEGSDMD